KGGGWGGEGGGGGGKGGGGGGKGQVGQNIAEPLEVALQHRIQDVEAGDRRRGEAGDARLQGQPAQIHGEEELQHQGEPEARHRQAHHRDEAQGVVGGAVAVERGEDTEREAGGDGGDHGGDG